MRTKEEKAAYLKAWRTANKERVVFLQRRWAAANRDHTRAKEHLRKYGISAAVYEAMRKSQGFKCAICKDKETDRKRGMLHVDHDHKSGAVRALLCGACNTGLGRFRDDPRILRRAAGYIEKHRKAK